MDALEVRVILLNKHCNGLQNPNKKQRKTALENIKKELFGNEADEATIAKLYKTIQKHLIRCIRDDSEACREYVISLITQIIENTPKDDSVLSLLFPELRERLASSEMKEPSEEVRLLIVILLHSIVFKYGQSLSPYLNDYIEILKKTIVDPYPKVKKESCECAADLSKAIPRDFHMQSESLIKPMVQAMKHQHYKIRVTVIKSLGDVILNGNNKSIETVSTPLAERLFDQNAMVRKAIAEVVGMWMLKLCDRYSYWHKLLPLMLTCLSDEILSQAEEAWKLWDAVGKQWALENEGDLKDKMDFLPEQTTWYPNGVRRPNLGCRELVQRQMSKYLPAIANELTDWKVDIRVKSAQLLCITVQHAESRITQEITKVLSAMYKAFCDEDQRVVENIERSAELIGYFVPMKVYCGQILPVLEDGANAGNLGVFGCAIKYSPKNDVSTKIADIVEVLDESGIYYSNKANEQRQLLNVLSSLINNSTCESVNIATQQLFIMLVSVQSITDNEKLRNESKELLTHLCTNNVDISDMDELSKQCTRSFLQRIESTVPHWTLHNPQLYVFIFILKELEFGVSSSLDIVFKMLKDSMDESVDPEVVLKILWTIFEVLQNEKLISVLENKIYFFETILSDILPKQLVWRAGRSAEALRTASAACLNQGLFNMTKLTSVVISCPFFDMFLPHLLSLIEDSVIKTRLYSLESLQTLIRGAKSADTLTVEHCDKLVPVVMKRLDDVSDIVRITSLKVIQTIYKEPTAICGDHVIAVLHNTLLIHLDDPVKDTRKIVLDTLKDIGKTNPTSLLSKIAIESFRDKDMCIKLVSFLREEVSNEPVRLEFIRS